MRILSALQEQEQELELERGEHETDTWINEPSFVDFLSKAFSKTMFMLLSNVITFPEIARPSFNMSEISLSSSFV